MATIQKVARLAYQTFSKTAPEKAFSDNFNRLKRLIKHVTAADVDLNPELVKNGEMYKPESGKAPITYIGLWEDDSFSMGIFVLKNGVTLPMHDHPGMHGLCKIISGTVDVKRYTALVAKNVTIPSELVEIYSKFLQPTRATPVTRINAETDLDACCLSPTEENFHEIQAINGPAAFLDILAPPYNSTAINVCHYFKDITPKSSETESRVPPVSWLLRIPQPLEFWCDTHPYTGPTLNPLALSEELQGDQNVT